MYTVIICPECEYAQIVKDDPKTTKCQQCRDTMKFRKLKHFFKDEELENAQYARASITAQQQGLGDEFEEMEARVDAEGITERIDEELLASRGLTEKEISAATTTTDSTAHSKSHRQAIKDALRECDPATTAAIIEYCSEYNVPEEKVRGLLERLVEQGRAVQDGDEFRIL